MCQMPWCLTVTVSRRHGCVGQGQMKTNMLRSASPNPRNEAQVEEDRHAHDRVGDDRRAAADPRRRAARTRGEASV
ncbi:MAG: hypothetical protein R2692_09110 [Microbacterium sp.]